MSGPKQPYAWWDFPSHREDCVGIECDDDSLCDEHGYMCYIFPRNNEKDMDGAIDRAEKIIRHLQGHVQFKRRP